MAATFAALTGTAIPAGHCLDSYNVLPVLLGAFPGVWLGSRWSVRMPDRALRPTLLVLVGASGLKLVGVI